MKDSFASKPNVNRAVDLRVFTECQAEKLEYFMTWSMRLSSLTTRVK